MTPASLDRIYAALARGDYEGVRVAGRRLLTDDPSLAAVHHAVGLTFCAEGLLIEALPHLERAADLDPATVRWTRDVGVVHAALHRWAECVARLTPIVPSLDAQARMAYLLAGVETHCADFVLAQVERCVDWRAAPTDFDARVAYGSALVAAKRFGAGERLLNECLANAPETLLVHDALADLFELTGRPEAGLHHRVERVRLDPMCARARLALAIALSQRGLYDVARPERLQADSLGLNRAQEHSSRLFMMLSDEHETATSLLATARQAFAIGCDGAERLARRGPRRASQRLRVGYVSGESRATPAYYFFRPFLEHHDRSTVEVTLFNTAPITDLVTDEYRRWSEHWRDVVGIPATALTEQIRREELDVLIDLSGHFPFNGLQIMAERLAPLQMTYPHFPGTTGNPSIDYMITDKWTSPSGTEHEYSERLYHVPTGYLGFDVSLSDLEVGPLPCLGDGKPTFGVFQRFSKFTAGVWDAIAEVLTRVPNATLLMLNGDIELGRPDSQTSRMVYRELDARGIDKGRVTLRGSRSRRDHLQMVTSVDVALDTFPYNGQTTTCESLWMGVPVVTLFGHSHVGRVSGALVARAGHPDWIAHSIQQYGETAASLVSDHGALVQIRQRLRGDFVDAGMTDGRRLARELETAYIELSERQSVSAEDTR
jgi:protein O-GlcNAc transferase